MQERDFVEGVDALEREIIDGTRQIFSPEHFTEWYECDFFVRMILVRSMACARAFADLVRVQNHYVAPALIRIQFEHLLALAATELHPGGCIGLAKDMMEGRQIGQMKSKSGQRMRPKFLCGALESRHGIKGAYEVYKGYSGFVHPDPKFIFANTKADRGDGGAHRISGHIPFNGDYRMDTVSEDDVRKWVVSMAQIGKWIVGGAASHEAGKRNRHNGGTAPM